MYSKYNNLKFRVFRMQGRKEGWKEEEGEGSLIDKSEPKKSFTQPTLAGNWTEDYSFSWIRTQTG